MSAATDRVKALRAELKAAELEVQAEKDEAESGMSWEEYNVKMKNYLRDEFTVTAKGEQHGTFLGIEVTDDEGMIISITEWDEVKKSINLDPNETVHLIEKLVGLGILHMPPRFTARF